MDVNMCSLELQRMNYQFNASDLIIKNRISNDLGFRQRIAQRQTADADASRERTSGGHWYILERE